VVVLEGYVLLADDRDDALQQRHDRTKFYRLLVDFLVIGDAFVVIGDGEQSGDFLADFLFLPRRKRQVRIEQVSGKHLRIARGVVPTIERRLWKLVATV
jgi:hypothetical protein